MFTLSNCLTVNSPKFGDLCLELLFTGEVLIWSRSDTVGAGGPTLVDGKLLLVALELSCELLDALLQVSLASLCRNERLAGLAKFLGL